MPRKTFFLITFLLYHFDLVFVNYSKETMPERKHKSLRQYFCNTLFFKLPYLAFRRSCVSIAAIMLLPYNLNLDSLFIICSEIPWSFIIKQDISNCPKSCPASQVSLAFYHDFLCLQVDYPLKSFALLP